MIFCGKSFLWPCSRARPFSRTLGRSRPFSRACSRPSALARAQSCPSILSRACSCSSALARACSSPFSRVPVLFPTRSRSRAPVLKSTAQGPFNTSHKRGCYFFYLQQNPIFSRVRYVEVHLENPVGVIVFGLECSRGMFSHFLAFIGEWFGCALGLSGGG